MAFCSKCGKELEDGAKFCPACGAAVEEGSQDKGAGEQTQKTDFSEKIADLNNTKDTTGEFDKEDIENNKINNEKDIKDIEAYCEQEKIELNDKLSEEIENNKKRQEELLASYVEKIKILEEVKNEKIEELTETITEAENNHQAYVDEVEEDIKQHAEQIEGLNDELNEATISLNTIQSTHEAVMKSNYDTFKAENGIDLIVLRTNSTSRLIFNTQLIQFIS